MVKVGLKCFRGIMKHTRTRIQQKFLIWSEQTRQLLSGKRSVTIEPHSKEEEQLEAISRVSEDIVFWETVEVFTVTKPINEKTPRICKLGNCTLKEQLTHGTNNQLQKRPQLLSMARVGTFQGVFEHKAPAIRRELEVGACFVSCFKRGEL